MATMITREEVRRLIDHEGAQLVDKRRHLLLETLHAQRERRRGGSALGRFLGGPFASARGRLRGSKAAVSVGRSRSSISSTACSTVGL